jgi:hypothetical protein
VRRRGKPCWHTLVNTVYLYLKIINFFPAWCRLNRHQWWPTFGLWYWQRSTSNNSRSSQEVCNFAQLGAGSFQKDIVKIILLYRHKFKAKQKSVIGQMLDTDTKKLTDFNWDRYASIVEHKTRFSIKKHIDYVNW